MQHPFAGWNIQHHSFLQWTDKPGSELWRHAHSISKKFLDAALSLPCIAALEEPVCWTHSKRTQSLRPLFSLFTLVFNLFTLVCILVSNFVWQSLQTRKWWKLMKIDSFYWLLSEKFGLFCLQKHQQFLMKINSKQLIILIVKYIGSILEVKPAINLSYI